MGPVSASGQKESGRLREEDVLNESEAYIQEHQLCNKQDAVFPSIRLVIAKIYIYGHRHLLQHLKTFPDKETKLRILNQWRGVNYENLDLLFQNLIRKKIMRVDEDALEAIETMEKYSAANFQGSKEMHAKGEQLLRSRKVGVLLFVGCSVTKGEASFDKQFYKSSADKPSLFEIMLERLKAIGVEYGMPPTYLFYNQRNYSKIKDYLKSYKFAHNIQLCVQGSQPILNLNGITCLKGRDNGDLMESPNGAGDFYHSTIKGTTILERLKMDQVECVCCVDCENMLEMVVDPYLVGLLHTNRTHYDLLYKCTYPQNQRDRIFRRIVQNKKVPKADTKDGLNVYVNYHNKHRTNNEQVIQASPIWMNSLVFSLQQVQTILKNPTVVSTFPQMINYTMKKMEYWSPLDQMQHTQQVCYVFERQLSDLFINHLFRSQAVMVEREEEYLPVITENKEYSWNDAYLEYQDKAKKKAHFFEKTAQGGPRMYTSLITHPPQTSKEDYEPARARPNNGPE